jgi:hypothetical protein
MVVFEETVAPIIIGVLFFSIVIFSMRIARKRRHMLRVAPAPSNHNGAADALRTANAADAANAALVDDAMLQHMRELQPADEEYALNQAVEASLSERREIEDAPSEPDLLAEAARREASVVASLRALPVQQWSDFRAQLPAEYASDDDSHECSMCMEAYTPSDQVKVLRCKHFFHSACIDQWFIVGQQSQTRSCPICAKRPIDLDSET